MVKRTILVLGLLSTLGVPAWAQGFGFPGGGSVRVGPGGPSGSFSSGGSSVRFGPGGASGSFSTPGGGQVRVDSGGGFGFGFPGGGGFGGGFGGGGGEGAGATGAQKRESDYTGIQSWQDVTPGNITQSPGNTFTTGPQTQNAGDFNGPMLPPTMTTQYGGPYSSITTLRNLPPTRLSSFVEDSGMDEAIYGDEGTFGPPPIDGFEYENTIGAGLDWNEGLTTRHDGRDELPSAWLYTGDGGTFGGGPRKRSIFANPGGQEKPGSIGGGLPGGGPGGGFPGGGPGGGFPGGGPGGGFPGN